jgi:hypothetical protein
VRAWCRAVKGVAKRECMKFSIGLRVGSGCGAVLVDEPAVGGVSSDPLDWADRVDEVTVVGCALAQAPVGSMRVVVLDVLPEKQAQLLFVADDRPVEELVAQGANPSLRERVRLRKPVAGCGSPRS